jgi:hypothetical protein
VRNCWVCHRSSEQATHRGVDLGLRNVEALPVTAYAATNAGESAESAPDNPALSVNLRAGAQSEPPLNSLARKKPRSDSVMYWIACICVCRSSISLLGPLLAGHRDTSMIANQTPSLRLLKWRFLVYDTCILITKMRWRCTKRYKPGNLAGLPAFGLCVRYDTTNPNRGVNIS